MIPLRIELAGFLSYRESQVLAFDDAAVWMLSGANGSGKSSIFDAVTYALFGYHRGGSQNASELINKESNALSVAFDVRLDAADYRFKRTLKRGQRGNTTGTQQVFERAGDDWNAVPDTTKKVDFEAWVERHVGLNYETFTSSVLLLQGKSEKLLDAKPSGRFDVLAGIVDLDRFRRLHEAASAKRLECKAQLDTLSAQVEGVPEVTELDLLAASSGVDEATAVRVEAHAGIERCQEAIAASRRWHEAMARASAAKAQLAEAEATLKDAVAIERDERRRAELRSVLPAVHAVLTNGASARQSRDLVAKMERERADAIERKQRAERELDAATRQRTLLQKEQLDDDTARSEVSARLKSLGAHMQTLHYLETKHTERKRLESELAAAPAGIETTLAELKAEADNLQRLKVLLPILERVQTERHDWLAARQSEAKDRAERERLGREGKAAKAEAEAATAELAMARQAKSEAEQALAIAASRTEQLQSAVDDFRRLKGKKNCRACGQRLTAEHFAAELAQREKEAKDAEAAVEAAKALATTVAERERLAIERDRRAAASVAELRDRYRDRDAAVKQGEKDIDRLRKSLDLRYEEMDEPHRSKISATSPFDWERTTYPERDELIGLRREAERHDGVLRSVRAAEEKVQSVAKLRTQLDSVRSDIDQLVRRLDGESPEVIRADHATLTTQETALNASIKARRKSIEAVQREIDASGHSKHEAETRLAELVARSTAEVQKQAIYAEVLSRELGKLPADWKAKAEAAGLVEHSAWKAELDGLEHAGTEAKFAKLEWARTGLKSLRDEASRLAAEADAYPATAKRATADIEADLAAARLAFDAKDAELRESVRRKDKLEADRDRRKLLDDRAKALDRIHVQYKNLAELLGKDRLQRFLVRRAERQIVDYANAMLDRLSGGQLFLRLAGNDDTDGNKALDLECVNRNSGDSPIGVAFLSGSQKFRVAVALALGIGQYASRSHRPIESVIIDEGFGCLDRTGRQVMIQELQNLRGQLHRILLVSHQEEFAEAFADGYRFELVDGSTRASRVSR